MLKCRKKSSINKKKKQKTDQVLHELLELLESLIDFLIKLLDKHENFKTIYDNSKTVLSLLFYNLNFDLWKKKIFHIKK